MHLSNPTPNIEKMGVENTALNALMAAAKEGFENKGDFFGTVVNKAARINAAAAPDEIRISDATRILARASSDFQFDDTVTVALKGLDGEHIVHTVLW